MIQGIDVSSHQADVEWGRVKRAGMEFAIVKCTEGEDFVDPRFNASRVRSIRNHGLVVGVYHYLRPRLGRTGAVEIKHALKVARDAGWGKTGDIRLAIDIEETDLGTPATRNYLHQAVEEYKRQMHHAPMIYSFVSFIEKLDLDTTHDCPLWLAHFDVSAPTIPDPWKTFTIWQKSSSASVGGESPVDLNVAEKDRFNRKALIPRRTVPKPKPDPKPDPKPGNEDIRRLQRSLNTFVHKWLCNTAPLIVDGDKGPLTDRYILLTKYYLGYGKTNAVVSSEFVRRMRHPRDPRHAPPGMILRGMARRRRKRVECRKERASGRSFVDGKPVPTWTVQWLDRAREKGWKGQVVSGIRTPAHSVSLCRAMCGAPSCPGRCAGLNSNHNATEPVTMGEGALDVSDYERFGRIMAEIGAPLKNSLGPRDPVHFSRDGT